MSETITAPSSSKTAYKRPYRTRQQRREADRRKTDESGDYKFLLRVSAGVALIVVLVLGFAMKGMMDRDAAPASAVESLQ